MTKQEPHYGAGEAMRAAVEKGRPVYVVRFRLERMKVRVISEDAETGKKEAEFLPDHDFTPVNLTEVLMTFEQLLYRPFWNKLRKAAVKALLKTGMVQ